MKDVFAYIRRTTNREYLLRCSYLEIYNEAIHDLLAPPSSSVSQPVQIQGTGPNIVLTPLREEVVTSLKGVREVLQRGEGNRRTASTDWNERSSRSHSVFRLVIESRERGSGEDGVPSGRTTPGFRPPTPGGPRLQARGGRSVQTSVLVRISNSTHNVHLIHVCPHRVSLIWLGPKRQLPTRNEQEKASTSTPGQCINYYVSVT